MMSSSSSSSSSITVLVDKATCDLLLDPDWTLNMDICDSINSDHWLAKDVVKAVKKRLQHKNPKIQFLALVLLEMMIKNCGDFLHFQVVEREVLQEMVKIVKKKTDMQVRDKILVLLCSWQEAFGGASGKYPQFFWAYADLRRSGIEFPPRSPDSALIFTPPNSHVTSALRQPQIEYAIPHNSSNVRLGEAMASDMESLSLSDLGNMQSIMELLSEMLKAVDPNDHVAVKDEVITDLVDQCRSNQKKIMLLVGETRDEELLCQGLEINDKLQSLLAKHDAIASGSPLPTEASEPHPGPSSVSSPPARTNIVDDEEEDEDDEFAQLARRNSKLNSDSTSISTGNQVALPIQGEIPTSAAASSCEDASASVMANALVRSEFPAADRTSMKQQDMIELLSITLASNPSPSDSHLTPPFALNQSGSSASASPSVLVSSQNPKPFPSEQANPLKGSYVVPWAQPHYYSPLPQPQSQSQVPNESSSYPPPPWAPSPTSAETNPFVSSTYQYSATNAAGGAYSPLHASTNLQQSFDSRSIPAPKSEEQRTRNLGQTSPKSYIYTSRLFNDLVDLRNPDGTVRQTTPASR